VLPTDTSSAGPASRRCSARARFRAGSRRSAGPRSQRVFGVPTPGAYARVRAWWSREQWRSEVFAALHSADAQQLRRAVGRRGPVSVKACYAVAVGLSAAADSATGRNAMPGNAALTAQPAPTTGEADLCRQLRHATGYGLSTVQKAVQVLRELGYLALIRTGKNWLTRDERLELHAAGSKARTRRNVWACTLPSPTIPATTSPTPVDNQTATQQPTNPGCDLPTTPRVGGPPSVPSIKVFTAQRASKTAPAGRAPGQEAGRNPTSRPARTYRADPRTLALAKDLRARVYWLRAVPHQRLMPALHRFAVAGWTARELQHALDDLLAARGWRVPDSRTTTSPDGTPRRYPLHCPWAYLAMLLRGLEPTDRAAELAADAELKRYHQLRRTGPACPHGEPAGQLPHPIHDQPGCPLCRHANRGAPTA